MPIRLAVVDGHTLARYGLRELIAQHPDIQIVAECESAASAQRVLEAVRPDVVTVEVSLPDGDGLRLAREFRDRYADLGIVVLASQGQDDVLFRALETGVSAFVGKTAPVEEMLAAIRHAAVAASSFTASGLAVALARRQTAQERLALSPRETEVLGLLGDGLSIPAISVRMFISQSTAKTYVARLYEKLGAANRAQALMTAIHHGLIQYQDAASSCAGPAGDDPHGKRVLGTFRPRAASASPGRASVALGRSALRRCSAVMLNGGAARDPHAVAHGPRRSGAACYGRTSYTRLNGVSAARRNRVNPASVMTCRIAASPACAPSA
jgi:DNA-binding NarL/FixJ family response regulator